MAKQIREQLDIYLAEYQKLKDEQISRIGFRDNLLYVNLGLFGGILSFALSSKDLSLYGMLVIPLVCLILGWTYLANDEKITSIGIYIQTEMTEEMNRLLNTSGERIFRWENYNRFRLGRKRRKIYQFIVNECSFVLSGIACLLAFLFLQKGLNVVSIFIATLEFILLLILAIEFFLYADFFPKHSSKIREEETT